GSGPLWLAAVPAAVFVGVLAVGLDRLLYRPVRSYGVLPPILLSVGAFFVLQNTVRFVWGNNVYQFALPLLRPYRFGSITITAYQIVSIGVAVAVLLLVHLRMSRTRFGRALRGTANNPDLAYMTGVDPERVAAGTWFLAGLLAALGGVLLGVETMLTPMMGWFHLLPLFAITLLGGLGSMAGVAVASIIVGLSQELSLLFIPASYKPAVAFVSLTIVLLFRPTGLFRL